MHWIDQPILEQLGQDAGEELLPQLVAIFIEDGQKNLAELEHALRRHDAEQLLLYLSPLGWEHINLTGDYLWRSSARIGSGKFRPLRPLKPA